MSIDELQELCRESGKDEAYISFLLIDTKKKGEVKNCIWINIYRLYTRNKPFLGF